MISPTIPSRISDQRRGHEAWIAEAIWGHRLERQPFPLFYWSFWVWRKACLDKESYLGVHGRERIRNMPPTVACNFAIFFSTIRGWKRFCGTLRAATKMVGANGCRVMKEGASLGEHSAAISHIFVLVSIRLLNWSAWSASFGESPWIQEANEDGPRNFIFPIGPAALYEAILEKGDGFERTRRVFTRTEKLHI